MVVQWTPGVFWTGKSLQTTDVIRLTLDARLMQQTLAFLRSYRFWIYLRGTVILVGNSNVALHVDRVQITISLFTNQMNYFSSNNK